MGLFAMRRRSITEGEDAPLSRGLLLGMLLVIGGLAFIVQTELQIPTLIIASVGAVGLVILMLVSLARPEIPLYLLAAYLPFSKQLAGDFGGVMTALNLTNLFLIIIFLGCLTGAATAQQRGGGASWLHWPVALIAFWGFLSFGAAWSTEGLGYFKREISEFKRWTDPVIFYFLFFHLVRDRQRWKNLVLIMMTSVVVVAGMAVWEYQNIASSSSLETSRVYGIADNPNSLGAFFVYYMFLFAGFWLSRLGQAKRWWLLVPFLLCFRGIMVTFSRGAYLAFAAGCLGLTFARKKVLFALTVALLAFAVMNPWLLPKGIQYRWGATFRDQNTQLTDAYGMSGVEAEVDTSSALRLVIWQGAQRMIADHPWVGVGLGRFQKHILTYAPELPQAMDAHNAYILAAAEQGIPMLVFFLLMVLSMLWMTYRLYRKEQDPFIRATALGWFGGLSGLVLANMFGSRMNSAEVGGYFWVLAALMARAEIWQRHAANERPQQAGGSRPALGRPAVRSRPAGSSVRPDAPYPRGRGPRSWSRQDV